MPISINCFSTLLTSAFQITILKFALLIFHGIIHISDLLLVTQSVEHMIKLKLVDVVMILLCGLYSDYATTTKNNSKLHNVIIMANFAPL